MGIDKNLRFNDAKGKDPEFFKKGPTSVPTEGPAKRIDGTWDVDFSGYPFVFLRGQLRQDMYLPLEGNSMHFVYLYLLILVI